MDDKTAKLESDLNEDTISRLQKELRVSQQCLFLVLKQVDEPVVVDLDQAKTWLEGDNAVGIDLDKDANSWVFTAGGIPNGAAS